MLGNSSDLAFKYHSKTTFPEVVSYCGGIHSMGLMIYSFSSLHLLQQNEEQPTEIVKVFQSNL